MEYYARFKNTFCRESYLHSLKSHNLRKYLTAFRTVSHKLEIETGRYTNAPRAELVK